MPRWRMFGKWSACFLQSACGWLADQAVPPARKGFFGLALGLATDEQAQRANARFLQELIVEPQDDFRAGFDGILGGYLLLAGESGLELIESRYLANPRAADGDVRHALVALRFYHEYGKDIPAVRLQTAVRRLLARPEFAAAAITDLARWQAWQAPESIAALYEKTDYSTPSTRLAIVGYLLACPLPQARTALRRTARQRSARRGRRRAGVVAHRQLVAGDPIVGRYPSAGAGSRFERFSRSRRYLSAPGG